MFETLRYIKKWLKTWKTFPVFPWLFAARQYRASNFAGAIRSYELGLRWHQHHPARFCARLDLAYCYFQLGNLEEAERHLKRVTAQLPGSREAHLRLAKLYIWMGRTLDAAWALKRARKDLKLDGELTGYFLYSALESEAPSHVLKDAVEATLAIDHVYSHPLLEASRLWLSQRNDPEKTDRVLAELELLASQEKCPVEVTLVLAEILLARSMSARALLHLRRALSTYPQHPRLLSLIALSYLDSGESYNHEFATQLALSACQATKWSSARELHVLAEAYYHSGDKMTALIVASKAKDEGKRLLGSYRDQIGLEQLIESLSSQSIA